MRSDATLHAPRRRGVAMVVAMALMALLAIVLVALTSLTRTQALYTRHVAEEAQLRQMLLAGERAAAPAFNEASADTHVRSITLPAPLREADGELVLLIDAPDADRREVRVRATLRGREAEQQLHYQRTDGGWHLHDARLGRVR